MKNEKWHRLLKYLKPFPTILLRFQVYLNNREANKKVSKNFFQVDELEQFKVKDATIYIEVYIEDVDENCLSSLGKDFSLFMKEGYARIFSSSSIIPEVNYSI